MHLDTPPPPLNPRFYTKPTPGKPRQAPPRQLAAARAGRPGGAVHQADAGLHPVDRSLEAIEDDILARLVTFPNVLVSSHQAYYTEDAVGQIIDATVRNVLDYRAGRRSENVLVPRS